jgi:hypothetical protein
MWDLAPWARHSGTAGTKNNKTNLLAFDEMRGTAKTHYRHRFEKIIDDRSPTRNAAKPVKKCISYGRNVE